MAGKGFVCSLAMYIHSTESEYYYYLHFRGEDSEAQRGELTCTKPHSWEVVDPG